MTSSVSSVEVVSPPMTATDIGWRVSPPSESASATGSEPMSVEMVVISIARRRSGPALRTAVILSSPAARSWFMTSTSSIALLTTTPTSRIIPMKLMTERRSPPSASSPKEPAVISGSENMTVSGWMNDSNCIAITM